LNIDHLLYTILATDVAFLTTYASLKWWIIKANQLGFKGRDMNKYGEIYVAEAGGVWVSTGVAFGLLTYIALNKYTLKQLVYENELMALSLLLFMSSFLGFLDDLLGWKKGLRALYRIVLMAPLSIPLVVIKAGYSTISIPFIGVVDLGYLYPLVLVPIGILGASNAFNMIAGYNGLEATQGVVLMAFTALIGLIYGINHVFIASIVMLGSLIAFLLHNWYPAKVFPGNSLTYGFGAYYASLVILGNYEKMGLMMFTLYFIEFILFIRGLLNGVYKENFGKPDEHNNLKPPYDKTYSLTHFAIKLQTMIRGKATERGVVITIALIQVTVCILSILLSRYI